MDDRQFDLTETAYLEERLQFNLRKTQPQIRIQFASLLKIVAPQIKDGYLTAGFENSPGFP